MNISSPFRLLLLLLAVAIPRLHAQLDVTVTLERLNFISYEPLQATVTVNNTSGRLTTDAMLQTGYYLTLPTWSTGSYPKVQINP